VGLVIAIVAAGVSGCPLSLVTRYGYQGTVTAHLMPQPVGALREAIRGLPGLEPLQMSEGSENCGYHQTRVAGLLTSITDCFGEFPSSDTGWAYWVSVSAWPGPADRGLTELDELVERIKQVVQRHVGAAKVSKKVRRTWPP
jgi:hypothetical protein